MSLSLRIRCFLSGFTHCGLFGWSQMPGGAERIFEETTNLEESQFADILLPLLEALSKY